ncbi:MULTISPECIES: cytochrome P450 [Mycolicibacterium]|uniref:Steroid C26-monooxygenase n=1 Tax=Mycolicibacterium fortuitum subsp. fortuitum DSM 46621 = ATCC 6841 = JCM 6387 TaxID=1214102 RepID=K0USX4_MYCFO|nr:MULTISPECIES: cytochrome P450 [Mycolicibacterium]AIY45994.1 putative cytochrome P450 hydroxylase [Mycobacterium sp. VKM Ac-1817D]CRL81515.1 cytochrome P450 [Mycolicibacter nonchromogenicus]AMD54541.1 cytochrome [Mycolicibacterium fortuitum subsp. fortuitum DSM 46621 = ATCC 6841 = JCM 6387]EJZ09891.1 cytochrome P450 [Mycolicibacterium fortuitum subsp. fortuitum DSM 46621 = ATCC 6841 = JCM 6387]WEV34856.1 cytochrome P450 [Mycolicibacterium fortuitum]
MTVRTVDDVARVLADPSAYTDEAALHAALTHLRANAPVSWVEAPEYAPFWAITKHADIMEIERANDIFTNSPRPVLVTREGDEQQAAIGIRTLIHTDDPLHRDLRAIGANWFRPKAMRALKDRADELAKRFVDRMVDEGPECDFVQQVAVNYPLYMIMTLLGVPESDFAFMLKLTQELFGSDDDEFKRGTSVEEQGMALLEMFQYFTELTASRRANPTDDLASTIANATLDGEPLSDIDTVSYYAIIAAAGHDTSSASISGGMHALLQNPDQLARLQDDMSLMPLAVEEMVRWTTPVKEFMRTAQQDYEIRGVRVEKGESVLLSYVSGNRDEDVFVDPFRFDVGRDPNKHIAFGYGVHFCLGAALARMEINSFFSELLPRLRSVELAGVPQHMATTFVGGLKHLPVRYTLR